MTTRNNNVKPQTELSSKKVENVKTDTKVENVKTDTKVETENTAIDLNDLVVEQLSFVDELLDLSILDSIYLKNFKIEFELRGNIEDSEQLSYQGERIYQYTQAYILAIKQIESGDKIETAYMPIARLEISRLTSYEECYKWFNPIERDKLFKTLLKNWSIDAQRERIDKRIERESIKQFESNKFDQKMETFLREQTTARSGISSTRKRRTLKK